MPGRKLRSKLDQVRHLIPLKHKSVLKPLNNQAQPDVAPTPPPPPKDYGEYNDVRYAIEASPPPNDPESENARHIFLERSMKRTPNHDQLPALPAHSPSPPPTPPVRVPSSPTVPPKTSSPSPPPKPARTHSSRIPIAAGRTPPSQRRVATISTPEEAELRRREARRRAAEEEAAAAREEAQRQARLKREKVEAEAEYARAEAARKAALDVELRRAAEERRRREAVEREAAALESMLAAERKRQERERRREETEKLQRWRKELEAQGRAQQLERSLWRERVNRERKERAKGLQGKKVKTPKGITVLLTGWVTVQSEDYLSWKRRHFELREDALVLFKDAEGDSQPLETFLLSRVQRIREWQDGFEELEPTPNSFALELKGERDARSMFTDTADDKENLLALLSSKVSTR